MIRSSTFLLTVSLKDGGQCKGCNTYNIAVYCSLSRYSAEMGNNSQEIYRVGAFNKIVSIFKVLGAQDRFPPPLYCVMLQYSPTYPLC